MVVHSRNGVSDHAFFILKKEGDPMGKNPFNRKTMEKVLFATFKHQLPPGRLTRLYLKRQAKNIQHGFEIGYQDGLEGKALVSLEELQDGSDSPLAANMIRRAFVAYHTGYQRGLAEREEVEK